MFRSHSGGANCFLQGARGVKRKFYVLLPIGEPAILKIVDGTQLVAKTNPSTQELEFIAPSALIEVLKAQQLNWQIPNLASSDIDVQSPNAPSD